MRVCLLGPVELTDGSRRVTLGGVKERVVLAVLALNANRVLSDWTLIDALWGDATPPSGVVALHSHVHRLRSRLEQADPEGYRLETRPGGYLLRLASDELDVSFAEQLLVEGRDALARGAAAAAAERLAKADALWRGRPLDVRSKLGREAGLLRALLAVVA